MNKIVIIVLIIILAIAGLYLSGMLSFSTSVTPVIYSSTTTTSMSATNFELIFNETYELAQGHYKPILVELNKSSVLKADINVVGDGFVNTMLLNSTEFLKSQNPSATSLAFYLSGTKSSVKSGSIIFTAPTSDQFYLFIANRALIQGQPTFIGNVTVNVVIYRSQ